MAWRDEAKTPDEGSRPRRKLLVQLLRVWRGKGETGEGLCNGACVPACVRARVPSRRGSAFGEAVELSLSAFVFSSPTRTSRPVWEGWLVASKRKRTAVIPKQPTPPAAMRDASLRAPHTATEAPTLPGEREACPGETGTQERRENGILREERPRVQELFIWSSPSNSESQEAPQGLPSSFSLPLPWGALPGGHLPQLAALGEWLDGFGCPLAHLWQHTQPATYCIREGDINSLG